MSTQTNMRVPRHTPPPPTAPRRVLWRVDSKSDQPIPVDSSTITGAHIVTEEDRERLFMSLVPLRGAAILCDTLYTAWQLILASARAEQMLAHNQLTAANTRLHSLRELFNEQHIPVPEKPRGDIKFIPHSETPAAIAALNGTVRMMCPGAEVRIEEHDGIKQYTLHLPMGTHEAYVRWALVQQGYVKQVLP